MNPPWYLVEANPAGGGLVLFAVPEKQKAAPSGAAFACFDSRQAMNGGSGPVGNQ